MAAQKNEEKRTYVRADLVTRVRVQPVTREEFEQHKATRTGSPSGGSSPEEAGALAGQLGFLARRLDVLEEKLDRILRHLDPDADILKESVCYGTAQDVSGAGVRLVLLEHFDAGQLVRVSLSVPGFSIGFLEAYGEIVRVLPVDVQGQSLFETSIKFLAISEDEREKLISYSFRRQRQAIRDAAERNE